MLLAISGPTAAPTAEVPNAKPTETANMAQNETSSRLDWVDAAKGICIILVVMMHSTLGVEKAIGTTTSINAFIEWARPFRMPDFFLISGLFLAARIDRPWRAYLDSKVVHFAYFYALWVNIQFAMKAPVLQHDLGMSGLAWSYLMSYVQPFGTLWFIYLLAVFFVTAKLLHAVPKPLILAAAALLHVAAPHTGWLVIDEFADRFVFFYSGYAAAPLVFALAAYIWRTPKLLVTAALVVWAYANWLAVQAGFAVTPGPDLIFGYAGVVAVIAFSVLITRSRYGNALAYCGQNSIIIYLAFPLFMAPTRVALLKVAGPAFYDAVAMATTLASVVGALALSYLVRGSSLDFLFARPKFLRLATTGANPGGAASAPQGRAAARLRAGQPAQQQGQAV
jgi:uncharacterized membrane protein YcfT